jgi:predicted lipoprotein with Yx(FWY)xxD motif
MLTSSRTQSPGRLAALFVAIALIVGACSSAATTPAPAAATAAPTTAPSASASAAAAGDTINVSETAAVGKFLTGPAGNTLYVFSGDTAANASTCVDACATNWPPLTASGGAPAAGTGVTGTLATFARADGSMQVSYNGKPLYYFAKDTKAGDTNGQGVAGKWTVAAP